MMMEICGTAIFQEIPIHTKGKKELLLARHQDISKNKKELPVRGWPMDTPLNAVIHTL